MLHTNFSSKYTTAAFDYVLELIDSAVIFVNSNGIIEHINHTGTYMIGEGYDKAVGQLFVPYIDLYAQDTKLEVDKIFESVVENGLIYSFPDELRLENMYGKRFYVEGSISPILDEHGDDDEILGVLIWLRDVMINMKLDKASDQASKVKSLAKLLSTFSAEIKKPVGNLMMLGQNINRRFDTNLAKNIEVAEKLGTDIKTINDYVNERGLDGFIGELKDATECLGEIASSLQEMSEEQTASKFKTKIDSTLNDALYSFNRAPKDEFELDFREIAVVSDYPENLPEIEVTAAEIVKAFTNILANAEYAMTRVDRAPSIFIKVYTDDDFLYIEIRDNGCGMSDEVLQQAFNPFYSTKNDKSKYPGLGLTVAYSIIEHNHDGNITLASTEGEGTTVKVQLPYNAIHLQ